MSKILILGRAGPDGVSGVNAQSPVGMVSKSGGDFAKTKECP